MLRILKVLGYVVVTLVVIVAIGMIPVYLVSSSRLRKTYTVNARPVAIPTDPASIERGQHIAQTRGCIDCHGKDFGGTKVIDDFKMGAAYGPNLTKGKGSVTASFTDEDWVRAIRHGLAPDGRGLFLMPANEFAHFSDADLGAVIAFLKSVPAVDRDTVPIALGPLARLLLVLNQIKIPAAELAVAPVEPENGVQPGPTAEYGRYLSAGCAGCHGPNFSGGKIPGVPPDWPPAQNLTPAGDLAKWQEADFFAAIRTHVRPDGTKISDVMPLGFGGMHDDELRALFLFFKTLPPAATGVH